MQTKLETLIQLIRATIRPDIQFKIRIYERIFVLHFVDPEKEVQVSTILDHTALLTQTQIEKVAASVIFDAAVKSVKEHELKKIASLN